MKSPDGLLISYITLDRLAEEKLAEEKKRGRKCKPLLSDARRLSDEELTAKLEGFGVPVDPRSFRERCEQYRSAQELSEALYAEHAIEDSGHDWVWFCVTILWERWFADLPNLEMIDDMMQIGYRRLARGEAAGACDAWISYWESVRKLMEKWNIESIGRFDEQFSQTQYLFNWCQDFEMELGNAAISDGKYCDMRLRFCEQIIPLVDPGDSLLLENMRRAVAECIFDMGEAPEADRLYEQWLSADPRWGFGWVGWSDLYWLRRRRGRDFRRAEQILTRALKVPGLRDREVVLERMSDLYEESGQKGFTSLAASPPLVKSGKKIGRNDPCPCGSGKKYKRCCGA